MGRVRDGFSDSSQVADIDGAIVCTHVRTEKNVDEAAQLAGAEIYSLGFETSDEVYATFIAGGCDLVADDFSTLVNLRERQQPTDQQWVLFGLGLNPSSPSATTPTTRPRPTTTKASSGGSEDYYERLAKCYFKEERPGYDFAGGGERDDAAMIVCVGRVKE